jgi:hypothetical protein
MLWPYIQSVMDADCLLVLLCQYRVVAVYTVCNRYGLSVGAAMSVPDFGPSGKAMGR